LWPGRKVAAVYKEKNAIKIARALDVLAALSEEKLFSLELKT